MFQSQRAHRLESQPVALVESEVREKTALDIHADIEGGGVDGDDLAATVGSWPTIRLTTSMTFTNPALGMRAGAAPPLAAEEDCME